MKSGLFWKLLGAQLVVVAIILLAALWLLRIHAADSFQNYLQAQETEQLIDYRDDLLSQLEQLGSWELLLAAQHQNLPEHGRTRRGQHRGPRHDARPGSPLRLGTHPRPDPRPPPKGPRLSTDGSHRPLILNPDGEVVFPARAPAPPAESVRLPLMWRDRLQGYVVQPTRSPQRQQAEIDFQARQTRAYLHAAVLAMLVATILAAVVAGWLSRRVRAIERGTRAFANRDFAVRVDQDGGDELAQLASQVNRLGEALARHEQRQKQWLADVAHELRTPLAVLKGELEALLEGVRSAGPEALTSLQEEVARLNRLVEDLNLLSLAESGGLRLDRADGDLRDLLEEVQDRFASVLANAGFDLQLDQPPEPASCAFDQPRLEQVLGNLISNVLRYATPGVVTLQLRRQQHHHRITLADSGPGVSAQRREQLFDRFYQIDGARSRQPGSSGLGLAICRSLVEAHGGNIHAAEVEGGLAILIDLPIQATEPSA